MLEVVMKKIVLSGFLFVFLAAANMFGQNPGKNESLIIVNALFNLEKDKLEVHINSQKNAELNRKNSVGKFVIPNGKNTVTAVSLNGYINSSSAVDTKTLPIEANSERIEIEIKVGHFHDISIRIISRIPLTNTPPAPTASNNIEGAIHKITETFKDKLPKHSTIAVISISSQDQDTAAFAIDELEYQLVDVNLFNMVDRKTLDLIRSEQEFQMSGDVSDDSAVSIGHMLGASIVITGNITNSGNTRRITIKALDVKTAQIIAMSREGF
jgi:TolB-like protein